MVKILKPEKNTFLKSMGEQLLSINKMVSLVSVNQGLLRRKSTPSLMVHQWAHLTPS